MRALLEAGVDVVRVNAAHGTPELRSQWIQELTALIREMDRSVAILVDLTGPRIRVGRLQTPLPLETDRVVVFAPEDSATGGEIPTTYAALAGDVEVGTRLLLDDGLLACVVEAVEGDRVRARVLFGGELKANKGINLPGLELSTPAVTERDRDEALRAVDLGVDYIGLSFVRRAEDILGIRKLLPPRVKLVAKIEKAAALRHLEGILEASDVVMVARGDLGVELPFEQVPLVQKRLIRDGVRMGKPVITATQMLESMIDAPRPTRAEASDVANAILDGTDAVMLSAETAIGAYPVEAVRAMDRIAREVESHRRDDDPDAQSWSVVGLHPAEGRARTTTEDAISVGVCAAARLLGAPAIVCLTASGFTARTVASYRPEVPILAVTPEPETYRHLALVWGVVPALVGHLPNYERMWTVARERLLQQDLARVGDKVVVTAGVPFDQPGTTNLLKVETV